MCLFFCTDLIFVSRILTSIVLTAMRRQSTWDAYIFQIDITITNASCMNFLAIGIFWGRHTVVSSTAVCVLVCVGMRTVVQLTKK